MTFDTVSGNTEGRRTIMTGSTGLTIFHVLHGHRFVGAVLSLIQVWVALAATELINMDLVRKNDLTDDFVREHYFVGMASDTITLDTEGPPAIMAGSAGFASLHLCHGGMIAIIMFYEDPRMTDIAAGPVDPVVIGDYANGLGLYGDFGHHFYSLTILKSAHTDCM